MLGERSGEVHHALFVLRTVEGQAFRLAALHDPLAEAGHVAVTEDAPETLDEAVLMAVTRDVLRADEPHQCLTDREMKSLVHGRRTWEASV